MRPKLLDLYSCAGGAAMGYHRAGFDVVGVDIAPQPNYPFEFHQSDALEYLVEHGHEFDAIHTSPPCQRYTRAQRLQGNEHPDLVAPTRAILERLFNDVPWIIENVVGAPLYGAELLCGSMFDGLAVYRHRLFESNRRLFIPDHEPHIAPLRKMGRKPEPGEFMHVVGNFSGVEQAKKAMGIDWMTRNEMSEAIPPAYTEFIGAQLIRELVTA